MTEPEWKVRQDRLDRLQAFCETDRDIARTWSGGQVQYPSPDVAVLRDCARALLDVADAVEPDRGYVEAALAIPLAEVAWLCQVYAAHIAQTSTVAPWEVDLPDLVQQSGLWPERLAAADLWGLF